MESQEQRVETNHEEAQALQVWHAPRLVELAIRDTESGQDADTVESSAPEYAPS
jgi:hypothetical protein